MREPATILCHIFRQVRQPMDSQYYNATKREQTRSIVARIFNTFIVFRVGLPAHNGLVARSGPAGRQLTGSLALLGNVTNGLAKEVQKSGKPRDLAKERCIF